MLSLTGGTYSLCLYSKAVLWSPYMTMDISHASCDNYLAAPLQLKDGKKTVTASGIPIELVVSTQENKN